MATIGQAEASWTSIISTSIYTYYNIHIKIQNSVNLLGSDGSNENYDEINIR